MSFASLCLPLPALPASCVFAAACLASACCCIALIRRLISPNRSCRQSAALRSRLDDFRRLRSLSPSSTSSRITIIITTTHDTPTILVDDTPSTSRPSLLSSTSLDATTESRITAARSAHDTQRRHQTAVSLPHISTRLYSSAYTSLCIRSTLVSYSSVDAVVDSQTTGISHPITSPTLFRMRAHFPRHSLSSALSCPHLLSCLVCLFLLPFDTDFIVGGSLCSVARCSLTGRMALYLASSTSTQRDRHHPLHHTLQHTIPLIAPSLLSL